MCFYTNNELWQLSIGADLFSICTYARIHIRIGSRLQISKVILSSQWMAVATPHVLTDHWPLCISFLPTVDLVPVREATLECRNAVDCFLGSIDAMRQILTDFALYDAGPTRWKVLNFTGLPTICSNVSPSLRYANLDIRTPGMVWVYGSWLPGPVYGLLRLQSDWMDGVARGQFAEMTSAVPCAVCGRPVYIPFCELSSEIFYSLGSCSTQLIVSLRTPNEVDDYMFAAKRHPYKCDNHADTLISYEMAAIWRDLAADGHVSDVGGYTHRYKMERIVARYRTEWLQKTIDRVNLEKLWALWAVSMKALLKMNIRMTLLVCERHIVGDPQHAIPGRVMKGTESVFSVLTYQFDRDTPRILASSSMATWHYDSTVDVDRIHAGAPRRLT
jgi:hypothetical protein